MKNNRTRSYRHHVLVFGLSIIMGIIGGFGAVLLDLLIKYIKILFFDIILKALNKDAVRYNPAYIALPVIGALFYILFLRITDSYNHTKGSGIPFLIERMTLGGGHIEGKIGTEKMITSAISLGSGVSGGKEGPMALIGASFGSYLADKFNLSPENRRILIIGGLSAGISGMFHTPFGGALFGIEVLAQGLSIIEITPIFIASAIGALIGKFFIEIDSNILEIRMFWPNSTEISLIALIFVLLAAILFGLIGILWVHVIKWSNTFFNKITSNIYLRVLIGSFIMGIILMFLPSSGINGSGVDGILKAFAYEFPAWMLIVLAFIKMIATSSTIGSGNSGGIFGPTLYIGALFGMGFGMAINGIAGKELVDPRLYALIGMAAVFSAATQAPLNIAIMIVEISNSAQLIPTLLLGSILSYLVSRKILGEQSIYSISMDRKGLLLGRSAPLILDRIRVREVMRKDLEDIPRVIEGAIGRFNPDLLIIDEFASLQEALDRMKDASSDMLLVIKNENTPYFKEKNESKIGEDGKNGDRTKNHGAMLSKDDILGYITKNDIQRALKREIESLGDILM